MRVKKVLFHKNKNIRAAGYIENDKREGYWKWYRIDGTKLRTGYFVKGKRSKEWMKYDRKGVLIKSPKK